MKSITFSSLHKFHGMGSLKESELGNKRQIGFAYVDSDLGTGGREKSPSMPSSPLASYCRCSLGSVWYNCTKLGGLSLSLSLSSLCLHDLQDTKATDDHKWFTGEVQSGAAWDFSPITQSRNRLFISRLKLCDKALCDTVVGGQWLNYGASPVTKRL